MTELVFNTNQRHEIYKTAYEYYLDQLEINEFHGICYCINEAFISLPMYPVVNVYKDIDEFPEFYKFQPADVVPEYFSYWWDIHDTEARIAVFKQIIKETENG